MIKECKQCGDKKECKREFCSLECYWKWKTNKRLSVLHKKRISEGVKKSEKYRSAINSKSFREKMRVAHLGNRNPAKRLEVRQKMKESRRRFFERGGKVWNDGIEYFAVRGLKNGIFTKPNSYKKGQFWSDINKKNMFYRSSSEKKCMMIFEDTRRYLKYEYEIDEVPYIDKNGLKRNTVPDFHGWCQDGSEEIIEYKPYWRLEKDIVKLGAVREYCRDRGYKFQIWSQKEIDEKR